MQPNANPEHVNITTIRNWPGRGPSGNRALANKVPTLIAFDEADQPHWGYNIPQRLRGQTIKYIKLLLEPDVSKQVSSLRSIVDPEATGALLASKSKSVVEVASLYVKCMWEHAKAYIIQQMGSAAYNFADKVVLFTVPAVWSERAKHNTYMIAVGAGLAHQEYQLHMVSEPEAAAISVLNDPVRVAQLAENDVYLVVDAGGGTVDLTSYRVASARPLKLEEVAAGDGDVCGATFLEVNFRELLRSCLGDHTVRALDPLNDERIMQDWESSIRAPFTGDDDWRYALVTPGIPASASSRIVDGMIQFTADEIRPVFTPVIDKVKELVRKQVTALERRDLRPKAILLVGGLGCSGYLASQLRDIYEETNHSIQRGRIEILQPDDALVSIAQGAVRCDVLGLGSLVSLRIARYNLGTNYGSRWDASRHLPEQKRECKYTGQWRAKDCIDWHIRRNDEIKPDQVIKVKRGSKVWEDEIDGIMADSSDDKTIRYSVSILASLEDGAPEYATPTTRVFAKVRFGWDLTKWPKENTKLRFSRQGRPYRKVDFDIHIIQSMAGMKFNLYLGGELVDEIADVKFLSIPEAMDKGRVYRGHMESSDSEEVEVPSREVDRERRRNRQTLP